MQSELTIHDYIDQLFIDKNTLLLTAQHLGIYDVNEQSTISQIVDYLDWNSLQDMVFNTHPGDAVTNLTPQDWDYYQQSNVPNGSNWEYINYYKALPTDITVIEGSYGLSYACANLMVETMPRIHIDAVTTTSKTLAYFYSGTANTKNIDVSFIKCTDITDLSHMFYKCTALENIIWGNAPFFDNAINLSYMFADTRSLKQIVLPANLKQVTDLSYLCEDSAVELLDLSLCDLSNVTSIDHLFHNARIVKDPTHPEVQYKIKIKASFPNPISGKYAFYISSYSYSHIYLDLSEMYVTSFSATTNIFYEMFYLDVMDIRNWDVTSIGIPISEWRKVLLINWNDRKIIVRDQTQKQWFITQGINQDTVNLQVMTVEEWEAHNNG